MKRFFSEALDRHVLHIVGFFIAALWGLVQFVDWLVEEFVLSPHLPGFLFLLGLLLVPSVALVAWRLSARKGDRSDESSSSVPLDVRSAGRIEGGGIILNVAVAVLVLNLSYGGRDLGRATRVVQLVGPTGDSAATHVAKEEFLKEVVLFHFDNATGNSDLDWMSYGVTYALDWDLAQDPFIDAIGYWDAAMLLAEKGYERGTEIPLALKREVARGAAHFLSGSITGDENGISVKTELYETATGRPIAESNFSGASFFELIDDIAKKLRQDLGIPSYRIDNSPDLPVAEILTHSQEALKLAATSRHLEVGGQTDSALVLLESAVAEDPTFAAALTSLSRDYYRAGRRLAADSTLRQAFRHLYRLPKRSQLWTRLYRYRHLDYDPEGAIAAAEQIVQLYPEDLDGLSALADLHEVSGDLDEAIEAREKILEIDPSQHEENLNLGRLLLQVGEGRRALTFLSRYVQAVPDQPDGYVVLARAYSRVGHHDSATAVLKQAEVLGDETHTLSMSAVHALNLGRVDEAMAYRQRAAAVAYAENPVDLFWLEGFDVYFYATLGRIEEAIESYHRLADIVRSWGPWSGALVLTNTSLLDYQAVLGGKVDWAYEQLDSLSATLDETERLRLAGDYLKLHLARGDTLEARRSLDHLRRADKLYPHWMLKFDLALGQGRLLENSGNCDRALELYATARSLHRYDRQAVLGQARCEMATGDFEAAEATLEEALLGEPADPLLLLQLGRLLYNAGRPDGAARALGRTTELLRDADPGYVPAQDARELLQAVERSEKLDSS